MTEMAEEALDRRHIRHGKHRAQQLTPELALEADLILTMEAQHLDELMAICPEAQDKAHTLKGYAAGIEGYPGDLEYDIDDPFRQPMEVYEEVAEEIYTAVKKVVLRLEQA